MINRLVALLLLITMQLLSVCDAQADSLSEERYDRTPKEENIFPEQWNNFSPSTVKALLCYGAKFSAIPSIQSLPPQISKLLKGASDPGGSFNATDVGGGPRTRMKIGARNANAILFVVEHGGIGYNSGLYFYSHESTEWVLRNAVNFGSESSLSLDDFLSESQRLFGCPHPRGNGVIDNDAESLKVFREAAARGDASAQYALGRAYADGHGVVKSNEEALAWFKRAIAIDRSYQYELGLIYLNGTVVNKDYAEALRRFRVAADNIHGATASLAYVQLGQMYYRGIGVTANRIAGFALRNLSPAYINDYSMQDFLAPDEVEEVIKLRNQMLQAAKQGKSITPELDHFLAANLANKSPQ